MYFVQPVEPQDVQVQEMLQQADALGDILMEPEPVEIEPVPIYLDGNPQPARVAVVWLTRRPAVDMLAQNDRQERRPAAALVELTSILATFAIRTSTRIAKPVDRFTFQKLSCFKCQRTFVRTEMPQMTSLIYCSVSCFHR